MRIEGEWLHRDDGVVRPTVNVHGRYVARESERFLVDSGADLLYRLNLPNESGTSDLGLFGIGGAAAFVIVHTVLELVRDDGRTVSIRGDFAAFTDSDSTDRSILGRDVLDNFDLILSRRRNEVLLLAPNHEYHVMRR